MNRQDEDRTSTSIFISSLFASIISTVVSNPIQVAKLKMQYAPMSCPNFPHQSIQLIRCNCVSFMAKDAVKGLSVVIPQTIISNAIFIQLYEKQRKMYIEYISPTKSTILASVVSRLVVSTVMNPMQALRVRIVNSTDKNKIKGWQGGLKITLIRDLTYSALYWSLVEAIRNYHSGQEYRGSSKQGKYSTNMVAGFLAGGFVAAVTTPLDIIKTRKQSGVKLNGSVKDLLISIYSKQGLTGLFSGFHFRTAKNGLHSALYLIFYEAILGKIMKPQTNYEFLQ